jgi:hypothetical protein
MGLAGISEYSAGKTAMFFTAVVGAIKPTESGAKSTAQVGISYPTALKAVTLIRLSILANTPEGEELLSGEIDTDESYFSYDTLMFCGNRHMRVDHKKGYSSGKVYVKCWLKTSAI